MSTTWPRGKPTHECTVKAAAGTSFTTHSDTTSTLVDIVEAGGSVTSPTVLWKDDGATNLDRLQCLIRLAGVESSSAAPRGLWHWWWTSCPTDAGYLSVSVEKA
ncbi:MAG: hypothetical protein MUF10_12150 [Thermoanaerobaculaceae bacterium]|jgi:hypothetical protein|nr:hypothetical protein [Thermoanaerobaculaceae bacterium]